MIGPGTINVTCKYSDTLCRHKNITVPATLCLTPGEACSNPPGLASYADSGSGGPYRHSQVGLIRATTRGPFVVEVEVDMFNGKGTELLLVARA